jgi:hypothetical protein
MSQQPKTETDRLASIIQVLQLGQKTGRLFVERNVGPTYEQGIITLVNGQVVQAQLQPQQGQNALATLMGWGHCRFMFVLESQAGTAGWLNTVTPPPSAQRSPNGRFVTGPLQSDQTNNGFTDGQEQPFRSVYTGPLLSIGMAATPYSTRSMTEAIKLIDALRLSRAHRRLYLLIDGKRTVMDLVRLMSHEPDEVKKLLQDLEHAGVIQA